MADSTNFGMVLKVATTGSVPSTNVVSLTKLNPPEVSNDAVHYNTLDSKYEKVIAGGVVKLGEIKAEATYDVGSVSGSLLGFCTSGSKLYYAIEFPTKPTASTWTFQAVCTKFKILELDPTKPDVLKAEITLEPDANMTIS